MNSISNNVNYKDYPLLYIDDLNDNLISFKNMFEKQFTIFTAESGKKGLEFLKENPAAIIIADQRMPEMTGVEFFKIIKDKYPNIIRILLTAYSDLDAVVNGINEGKIFSYIGKPVPDEVIKEEIKKAIMTYHLARENERITKDNERLYREKLDAMKKLVSTNRVNVITSMASGVADRLGNYLQAIVTFFDLLPDRLNKIKDELNTEIKELSQGLFDAGCTDLDKLRGLTDEMRSFCQPPKYQFEKAEPSVFIDIINELHPDLKPYMQDKTIKIEKEISGQPPAVYIDRNTIKQVLYHMLRNSIQAIPETRDGFIQVIVSGPIKRSGKEFIRILVQDNGSGIDNKHKENIFNPFMTTKGTVGGLGLGLTTCQFIITQHEGEIELDETEIGKGSTFHIDLPVENKPPELLPDYRDLLNEFRKR